jgi:hypothetical protein
MDLNLSLGPEVPDDGERKALLMVCVSQARTETRDAREWGGVVTFSAAREKWLVRPVIAVLAPPRQSFQEPTFDGACNLFDLLLNGIATRIDVRTLHGESIRIVEPLKSGA